MHGSHLHVKGANLRAGVYVRTAHSLYRHSSSCRINRRQVQLCSWQHVLSTAGVNTHDVHRTCSVCRIGPTDLQVLRLRAASAAHQAIHLSSTALVTLSGISHYTGQGLLHLNLASQHPNPFTEVVWRRGPRRWLGLRKGHPIRVERTAPWLLELRRQTGDLQHCWHSIQRNVTAHNSILAAAVVAGILLLAFLAWRTLQKQGARRVQPQEDPEVLARKAASLEQQRSRFRRALGGEEDVPAMEPALEAIASASTLAATFSPADQAISSEQGLDDFDAWDSDTQKQWKRFMKGSRSQEIDEEQWWDIDREELPADRPVYHDFN